MRLRWLVFDSFSNSMESPSLAANAQYWLGERQYQLGHYKEAVKFFYHVVSYYPLSPKLATSTLKISQTYTRLKDHEKARMTYARVAGSIS
jgi:TolA-binding protein